MDAQREQVIIDKAIADVKEGIVDAPGMGMLEKVFLTVGSGGLASPLLLIPDGTEKDRELYLEVQKRFKNGA